MILSRVRGRHSRTSWKPTRWQVAQIRRMTRLQLLPLTLAVGCVGGAIYDFGLGGWHIGLGFMALGLAALGIVIFYVEILHLPDLPLRRKPE